jgi:hypothetical protein
VIIYGDLELLTIAPNSVSQWGTSIERPTIGAANPQGNVVVTTTTARARGTRELEWICATRSDLIALEAFLDARRGQLVECWIPTYQRDIEVLAVIPFYGTVVKANPASDLFGTKLQWRHYLARAAGGTQYKTLYWDISEDLGDGTHRWNTSPGVGPLSIGTVADPFSVTTANGFMHSRLLRSRMASDSYRVRYVAQACVVNAEFVECGFNA